MRIAILITALISSVAYVAAQSTPAQSAADVDISAIPACFLECSSQAAIKAKCENSSNLPCICVSDVSGRVGGGGE